MNYVVAWKDLATGICGRGNVLFSKGAGEAWIGPLNETWEGKLEYWLEPADDKKTLPDKGER